MSKIMEMADAYAEERHVHGAPQYNAVSAQARAALQAEVEKLEARVNRDYRIKLSMAELSDPEYMQEYIGSMHEDMVEFYAERDALREKLAAVEKDAARWRYTQKKGYFTCGPTDYEGDWMGYVVGVQRKGKSVNESVQGRGDTLVDAIDAAMEATK